MSVLGEVVLLTKPAASISIAVAVCFAVAVAAVAVAVLLPLLLLLLLLRGDYAAAVWNGCCVRLCVRVVELPLGQQLSHRHRSQRRTSCRRLIL
jgi:hypothetical protein